ncbi:MAG: HDOD domain-containing protein [Negativicutes bacterium]|nr:HDOD domain-containing protein [Negativicutes bacterium]
MGRKILFVDDERSILKAIERLFFDFDCELVVAESGEEGLRLLAENSVDVVVSDMRMPGMDGHQFLRRVKALYPGTTRLILSGYADEKEIFESLIDGSNSLYLFKPWNGDELKKKIEQIFAARQIYRNPALLSIVNSLENLSLVTGIFDSVSRLIDEDAEIGTIARVIQTDPTVTAAILRIVNSAFFNVKTGSVSQAITFLGLAVLKAVVLSCTLSKSANIKVPPFSIARLTNHASTANILMEKIYTGLLKKPLPESLVTAGLLHNLGLVLCLHYFPVQYRQVIAEHSQNVGSNQFTTREKEMFGVTHAEMGGYLLDWWGIPYAIVECALFHHEPLHEAVMDREAVCAVHIANHYAWKSVAPILADSLEQGVFAVLHITQRDCEKLLHAE